MDVTEYIYFILYNPGCYQRALAVIELADITYSAVVYSF